MQLGPKGGELYDAPKTLYVRDCGWVTFWSEVFTDGAIVKRAYERRATNDEIFIAQMLKSEQVSRCCK